MTKSNPLGKSLLRKKRQIRDVSTRHTSIADGAPSISITENTSIDEFIANAEAAEREFTAHRGFSKIIVPDHGEMESSKRGDGALHHHEGTIDEEEDENEDEFCSIPKKPDHFGVDAEEFKRLENQSFLQWKRSLNRIQLKYPSMPLFEKNLDFWRQLWKILELSDVLIQVVDARNPLFYESTDLALYLQEIAMRSGLKKSSVLLLNKADFLSRRQREIWSNYFKESDTLTIFFSAIGEHDEEQSQDIRDLSFNSPNILSPQSVLELFKTLGRHPLTVGFVGYPNVGKSSSINRFLNPGKRLQVSATPGKTKHFQTHELEGGSLILVDGPGLVIPSFKMTKAEMVLGGILPIDNLTDYMPSVETLLQRISFGDITKHYGIMSTKILQAADRSGSPASKFLSAFGLMRGFMKPGGVPDTARAARLVLKDFVQGKLVYCSGPPNADPDSFKPPIEDEELSSAIKEAEDLSIRESFPEISRSFGVHVRGKKGSLLPGQNKKHHSNKKKREKVRRVYPDSNY
ncbi:large subunit GTPase 1 homolog [Lepeophtheirus salmonis]|uniref:large subunit GTPase 1 homolog n=1 Tax=Lepeophtheirus salmonis TaxID=72036 RepID=UPI001AE38566|nr:large subunit GTPase 1 homolog [Lepeophtheirus salmonis]